jgi:fatty-acid desaturase
VDVTYYLILLLERLGLATDVIQPRHVRRRTAPTA